MYFAETYHILGEIFLLHSNVSGQDEHSAENLPNSFQNLVSSREGKDDPAWPRNWKMSRAVPSFQSFLGLPSLQTEWTSNNHWQMFRALSHSSFFFLFPLLLFPLPPPLLQLHFFFCLVIESEQGAPSGNRKPTTNWMDLAHMMYGIQ